MPDILVEYANLIDQLELRFEQPGSIDAAFWNFHTNHPEVYEGLVRLAYQADRDRLGIKMLFEVLRWEWIIRGLPDDAEEFKLNNNYTSRYARLIMESEPGLEGVFETRRLTT